MFQGNILRLIYFVCISGHDIWARERRCCVLLFLILASASALVATCMYSIFARSCNFTFVALWSSYLKHVNAQAHFFGPSALSAASIKTARMNYGNRNAR